MNDLAVIIPCTILAVLGGLGIGGILFILAKHYVKSRLRKP
ncbi:MAG TPA: hypothetical protein PKC99_17270 [Anaerolineales bacterium]|nr:hypothetical protein [Anaerolineales bacterium]